MSRQRLRTLLTVLSLLLTAALVVLWVRSLTVSDCISHSHAMEVNGRYARREWEVSSAVGLIFISRDDLVPIDGEAATSLHDFDCSEGLGWSFGPPTSYTPATWDVFVNGLSRFGLRSGVDKYGRKLSIRSTLEIPDWVLLLLVSLPAQWSLVRRVRAQRARRPKGFPVQTEPRPSSTEAGSDQPAGRSNSTTPRATSGRQVRVVHRILTAVRYNPPAE